MHWLSPGNMPNGKYCGDAFFFFFFTDSWTEKKTILGKHCSLFFPDILHTDLIKKTTFNQAKHEFKTIPNFTFVHSNESSKTLYFFPAALIWPVSLPQSNLNHNDQYFYQSSSWYTCGWVNFPSFNHYRLTQDQRNELLAGWNCNNTVPLHWILYPASSWLHSQDMHAPHASYKPRVPTGDQLDI